MLLTEGMQYFMIVIMNCTIIHNHHHKSKKIGVYEHTHKYAYDSNWAMWPIAIKTFSNEILLETSKILHHIFSLSS